MTEITESKDEPVTALKSVYLSLRNDRLVTSQADFARKLKFNAVNISEMLRGLKPIPIRLLKDLYKKYGININYLISDGKDGPIYLKDLRGDQSSNISESSNLSKNVEDRLQRENEMLKKAIKDKDKIIQLLEKQKP